MNKLISLAKVLSKLKLLVESRSIIRLASGEDGFLSNKMRADLARIAQETYDEWEQDEEGWSDSFGEIGVGGICHIIAERIISYLDRAGYGSNFNSCSVSDPFVQHVYVVAWVGHKNEDADPDQEYEKLRSKGIEIAFGDEPYKSPNLVEQLDGWEYVEESPVLCEYQGFFY
jgi:hypothetical protein